MGLAKKYTSNDDAVRALLEDPTFRVAPDGELWRKASRGPNAKHNWRWYRCRTESVYGYLVVRYHKATLFVHRVIYAALVGPLTPGLEINHKNGIKTDNRPGNLEEVTPSENMLHAHRTGLNRGRRGERVPRPSCAVCGARCALGSRHCSHRCATTAYHARRRAGAAA